MPDDTYLFIDGEYLRRIYREAMQSVFCQDGELDPKRIRFEYDAVRAFFYDCLDDTKRAGESEKDYQAIIASQEALFTEVSKISGFHFRPGTLKGGQKRRRQKEVDVQLAVDMLVHGFNKNMRKAVLLAGDLDFRPIVEVLVQHGVFVEIWYERTSASKELPMAADFGKELVRAGHESLRRPTLVDCLEDDRRLIDRKRNGVRLLSVHGVPAF